MNVYFISGVAADRTIFKHIRLPGHCQAIYLDWIPPHKNESLPAYALRLAKGIDTTVSFALIGLSLGGMLAVEIAKQTQPFVTVLISSIPAASGVPSYFKMARVLRLHKFIPVWCIQRASLLKRFFTNETKEDKRLLRTMIRRSDAAFIKWSMQAVLTWENEKVPPNLLHIHGTHDEILPMRFVKPTHVIANGRHLMVLNHAAEINTILQEVLRVIN